MNYIYLYNSCDDYSMMKLSYFQYYYRDNKEGVTELRVRYRYISTSKPVDY